MDLKATASIIWKLAQTPFIWWLILLLLSQLVFVFEPLLVRIWNLLDNLRLIRFLESRIRFVVLGVLGLITAFEATCEFAGESIVWIIESLVLIVKWIWNAPKAISQSLENTCCVVVTEFESSIEKAKRKISRRK